MLTFVPRVSILQIQLTQCTHNFAENFIIESKNSREKKTQWNTNKYWIREQSWQ